jgi:pyridoxine 4-dehydrogenase
MFKRSEERLLLRQHDALRRPALRPAERAGHIARDRSFRARGNDRILDPLHVDERPPSVAALVPFERYEREHPVGARELAVSQRNQHRDLASHVQARIVRRPPDPILARPPEPILARPPEPILARPPEPILARAGTLPPVPANPDSFALGGDLEVFRLGFGAMRITGPGIWHEPADPEGAHRLLRHVVDRDVNLIDTADSYGPEVSENLIAEALRPYPENLVIATKGGFDRPGPNQWVPNCRPERLKRCCEGSLRRLKLERIDLYQLHTVDPKVPIEDSVGALAELQGDGKIRHIGLSNVGVEEIERAQSIVSIVSVQNHYNVSDRASEDVLRFCDEQQIAFLPYVPLAVGDLAQPDGVLAEIASAHGATPAQVALAWLLQHSPVTLPIPGTSQIAHFDENREAVELELEVDELEALDELAPAS